MSVEPGFGGQSFDPAAIDRIRAIDRFLKVNGLRERVSIQVDGGIGLNNAAEIVVAGADNLVAGSAIFGTPDPTDAIKQLRKIVEL